MLVLLIDDRVMYTYITIMYKMFLVCTGKNL
ncbi:hypothetical protein KUCAC02_015046 [Chaenocephalus aceratus]|uniref:Uncharacterized protein n=1 Tax=Chaenocephalus aceratus TaxID=36190 RepID=A0ACB9XXH7_CHAAC|nr:hypothetical protein KUCAC02_015046 [Chaenocephalus aceratus]